MAKSRKDLRREHEAFEARQGDSGGDGEEAPRRTRKTATKKKAKTTGRRTKTKEAQRKRLVWGIFSGSMKEEGRFPYDQRKAAEERLEQLRAKATKKLYFIQPIKEPITASAPVATAAGEEDEE